MLTTLFALFALVQLQHFAICNVLKVTTHDSVARTQQTREFVDKLKKSLRRDNDDYRERARVATTPAPASLVPRLDEDPYVEQVNDMYRRMMQERHSRRRYSHRRSDVASNRDWSEESAEPRKHRSGKKHNMLDEGGAGVPYVSAGAKLFKFRLESAAALEAAQRRVGHDPGAADLDMAPARGSRVDALRDKKRLCHRHVLIPEGPKYDSRGAVRPRGQSQHAARVFSRTARAEPQLILPRCCNCCENSVLGCE